MGGMGNGDQETTEAFLGAGEKNYRIAVNLNTIGQAVHQKYPGVLSFESSLIKAFLFGTDALPRDVAMYYDDS